MGQTIGYIGIHCGEISITSDVQLPPTLEEIGGLMAMEAYLAGDAKRDYVIFPRHELRVRESELVRVSVL